MLLLSSPPTPELRSMQNLLKVERFKQMTLITARLLLLLALIAACRWCAGERGGCRDGLGGQPASAGTWVSARCRLLEPTAHQNLLCQNSPCNEKIVCSLGHWIALRKSWRLVRSIKSKFFLPVHAEMGAWVVPTSLFQLAETPRSCFSTTALGLWGLFPLA